MKQPTSRALRNFIGLVALIGVGSSASFYFRPHGNPNLAVAAPTVTAIHVILGGIWLALAPFQFIKRIRDKYRTFHRLSGRYLVVTGLLVGLSAIYLALVVPFSGWSERILVTPFAVLFTIATMIGFWHVRNKRIRQHKEWMARAFSIGLSIGTMRIFFFPGLTWLILEAQAYPATEDIALVSIVSFTTAFIVHTIGVELWIRRERQGA